MGAVWLPLWSGTAVTVPRRSHDDYVKAASAALREHGSSGIGGSLTMARLSEALGVSRSTLYRWWNTTADAAIDVVVHSATSPDSWDERFLDQPPSGGVGAGLAAALVDRTADLSVTSRCAVAGWAPDSPGRAWVARHERRWIARCASWLAAGQPTEIDVCWTDVAIVLRAMVEGMLFLRLASNPDFSAPWSRADAVAAGDAADALVVELTSALRGVDRPMEGADAPLAAAPRYTRGQREALERLNRTVDGTPAAHHLLTPNRLVDLDRLARQLGVSPRRLYMVWPTVADLNGDLVVELIRDNRALVEKVSLQALGTVLEGKFERVRDLLPSVFAVMLDSTASATAAFFAATIAMVEAPVRYRAAEVVAEWTSAQRVLFLAMLQAIGDHLKPVTDPDAYVFAVFGALAGSHRLALLHPELVQRTVWFHEEEHPCLPAGITAACRSFTESCEH